jgi:L-iditol 2-dehydrogenase
MAEGKLRVDLAITHVMPLTEWREAFDMLRRKEGLKILLDPSR